MWIDSTNVLQQHSVDKNIELNQTVTWEANYYKEFINSVLQWKNSWNETNLSKSNSWLITLDLSWINIEIFLNSMFLYQSETQKDVNIRLINSWIEIWTLNINSDSQIDLILRDIKRLKIGSIKSFPKKSKEKLSVYDLEKDRENFFQYISWVINNKYNDIFLKQNISLTNSKLFYKEIYEDDECAEFCITMIHFLEFIMRNKYQNNQKANANIIFDEVLNTVSKNSWLHLNWEIIKKSFWLIKRFWSYSSHFRDKLTFN